MNTTLLRLEIDAATKALSGDRCAPMFQVCHQGRVVGPALGSWPKCKVKNSRYTKRETWANCWPMLNNLQENEAIS